MPCRARHSTSFASKSLPAPCNANIPRSSWGQTDSTIRLARADFSHHACIVLNHSTIKRLCCLVRDSNLQPAHLAWLLEASPDPSLPAAQQAAPASTQDSLQGPLGHFVACLVLGGASAGLRKLACSCLKLLHTFCHSTDGPKACPALLCQPPGHDQEHPLHAATQPCLWTPRL